MTWLPADYDGSCNQILPNHSVPLTLVCFLIQYFGGSNDEILTNIYPAQDPNERNFDFIIVGAGSAGCVVTNRLSERSDWKVRQTKKYKYRIILFKDSHDYKVITF